MYNYNFTTWLCWRLPRWLSGKAFTPSTKGP